MHEREIRRLPVLDAQEVRYILTRGDIIRAMAVRITSIGCRQLTSNN